MPAAIIKATLKTFDSGAYTASVQMADSLALHLTSVKVSRAIPSAEMVAGRTVALLLFDDTNPSDGVIISVNT